MDKVKKFVNSSLFKAACAGAIGALLLAESHPLYGGVALGLGLREALLAFKQS